MRQPYRPVLEVLEDRLLPAVHTWSPSILSLNHLWSNPLNWNGGVPTTAQSGGTIVKFAGNTNSTDDISGLVVDQLQLTAGDNTLSGATGITLGFGGSADLISTGINTIDKSLPIDVGNITRVLVQSSGHLLLASAIGGNQIDINGSGYDGEVAFAGSDANTYGGDTIVEAGTVVLDKSVANGAIPGGHFVIGSRSLVQLDQAYQINPAAEVDIGVGTVLDLNGYDQTVNFARMQFGSLIKTGSGTFTLKSELIADGPGSITGNLTLGANGATFDVSGSNHELDINATISGPATAPLIKTGAGVLGLLGYAGNSYTGTTQVLDGTLSLQKTGGVAIPGDIVIQGVSNASSTPLVDFSKPNQINPNSVVEIDAVGQLDLHGFGQTIGQLVLKATSFSLAQSTTADAGGVHTSYSLTHDGVATQTNAATVLGKVVVTGTGAANTATLITNDTYSDANGKTQETRESVTLGSLADPGTGTLQKFDQSGKPLTFLTLRNFPTSYAYVGRNDGTVQLYGTAGAPYNGFVSAGNYAYIGGPGLFHLAQGATSVYGYSAGQASDFAYHYSANPGSSYVVSGTAFSYMSATDNVGGVTESFFNVGVGFQQNTGVSNNPGKDYAYIIDSPGNDAFVGGTAYSFMYATNAAGAFSEFDAAFGFAIVFGESFVGGVDTGVNGDSTKNILVGFHL